MARRASRDDDFETASPFERARSLYLLVDANIRDDSSNGFVPSGPSANPLARWFQFLHERCAQAIDDQRPPRSSVEEHHLRLRRLIAIERNVHRELEKRKSPAQMTDDDLARLLHNTDRWEHVHVVQRAIKELAALLGVDPSPPSGWPEVVEDEAALAAPRTRGPDLEPRRRPPPAPARPKKKATVLARREEAVAERADRIVRLLGRHADGLSANVIRQKLTMGRTETAKTLAVLVRTGKVERRGTRNDSRYLLLIEVVRKRGAKSSPKN